MLSIIPVSKDGSICLLAMRPYSKESIIKVDIEMTLANIFRLRDLSEPLSVLSTLHLHPFT